MATILLIDTALELGSVSLSVDGVPVAASYNEAAKEHAGWLQPAITALLKGHDLSVAALDAVAVSAGPGSYTGLRVAMATAKGLCFALSKPLIAINTLAIMAHAASRQLGSGNWFCPMIDARRMEVFTGVYDAQLEEKMPPQALILTENSFDPWLAQMPVCFFGNGAGKYKNLLKSPRASFEEVKTTVGDGAVLAAEMYSRQAFADLAYAEPFYLKPFYSQLSVNS